MRFRQKTGIALTALITAAVVTGCAPQAPAGDDGTISVVASTNVYGNIAELIGGGLIEVTSIIDDPSQDPHSFEADARVQLAFSRADLVIENGGGYDAFVGQLLSSLDDQPMTLSAVELSPLDLDPDSEHDHDHSANEHVWYDFPTMAAVASGVSDALAKLDPEHEQQYEQNAATLVAELDALRERAHRLHPAGEVGVAVTEPVSLYLLEAIGLHNETPPAFSAAIEGGVEVSAATLDETLRLFERGAARILVYNDQTTSPETEALKAAAQKAGAPIVSVTELLPDGVDYVSWMNAVLDELESALAAV